MHSEYMLTRASQANEAHQTLVFGRNYPPRLRHGRMAHSLDATDLIKLRIQPGQVFNSSIALEFLSL